MPELRPLIREEAAALGFGRVRFASAEGAPGLAAYDQFLAEERQGSMAWMVRGRAPRAEPRLLLPDARSAVVLGTDYAWPRPPDPGGLTGKVASYAWGRDYHNLIGKRLRRLVLRLQERVPGLRAYGGVDSRPLIERAWAERAGLGYIGKNACAIVPSEGSYFFLSVVLLNLEIEPDPPLGDFCGRCRRCLDGCPTDAFTAPGQLDARRCLSYLTIEHDGEIPEALRPALGRWVFGCDVCQELCPHNHRPVPSVEADLAPRPEHAWLDLPTLLRTPDEALCARFAGSPIRRAAPIRLKRNAAVVLGNLGDPAARLPLEHALRHEHEVVRSHAAWALERL